MASCPPKPSRDRSGHAGLSISRLLVQPSLTLLTSGLISWGHGGQGGGGEREADGSSLLSCSSLNEAASRPQHPLFPYRISQSLMFFTCVLFVDFADPPLSLSLSLDHGLGSGREAPIRREAAHPRQPTLLETSPQARLARSPPLDRRGSCQEGSTPCRYCLHLPRQPRHLLHHRGCSCRGNGCRFLIRRKVRVHTLN